MAYGLQAYLKLDPTELDNALLKRGLVLKDTLTGTQENAQETIYFDAGALLNDDIQASQLITVRTHLDPAAGWVSSKSHKDLFIQTNTPVGSRLLRPSVLILAGSTEPEQGDIWPDTFVLGITIGTRYDPTLIDWKEEHGIYMYDGGDSQPLLKTFSKELNSRIPELTTFATVAKVEFF